MLGEKELRTLCAHYSDPTIAKAFGKCPKTIQTWRKQYGIPPLNKQGGRRASAHSLDIDFFSEIDNQDKAYILGFIAADGHVDKKGQSVSIALKADDEQILLDIRAKLASNALLYDKYSTGGFPGSKPQKRIHFSSRKLVSDLAKWGIVPRKSYTLTYPHIPENLDRHFIRGVFDGDGSIGEKQFSWCGTSALLREIQDAIFQHTGNILADSYLSSGHPRLTGKRRDRNVLHWLYEDATIFLHRKYQRYLMYWS